MAQTYIQRHDEEWVDVTDGQLVACCDCGLVHHFDFEILDGRILRRTKRLNLETSYRRKRNDVKASIKTLGKKAIN